MPETLTKLDWLPHDPKVLRCACCGSRPSLWELNSDGKATKMVNCDRSYIHPNEDDATLMESCPLYSTPGMVFNKPTRREAINYWNWFNARLIELRDGIGGEGACEQSSPGAVPAPTPKHST